MDRLNHSNICDKVYEILSEQIINYKLKPGERLPEEQLAGNPGVRCTPIRGAIGSLVKDGFAEMKPRKGAFVKDLHNHITELKKHNIKFLGKPLEFRPGVWTAYFRGPDGEVCEFRQQPLNIQF